MPKRWSKRRVSRVEVKHHLLIDLPKQSSSEVIQALLTRVRAGDTEACQKLVQEHMLLVKLKVQDFLGDYPHLKKETGELVSVAMLACVEAINRVKEGSMQDHNNITGYIRVAIWRFLGEWVNEYLMNATCTKPLPNAIDIFETNKSWIFEQESTTNGAGESCLAVVDDHACLEIRDVLESLGLVENEWYIIESRMVGDTNEEIAEALEVTEFTIRFILSDIYRRFTEKYEAEQCTL